MIASASPRAEEREEARDDDARAEAADGAAAAAQEAEDDGDEDATLVALVDPPRRARPPVVICSSGAVVGFVRAVPCVQTWLSAIFAEPMHALERQPAQAVLRVDLGTLSPAENVAAVHAQTPESSRRRRSSSRPPSTALGGSAATRAIGAWDRAGQRHRTRPRPSRPAPPNGCSGHPAGSSSGRSTVQPSTARGATRTRPMTHAARRRCGARDAPQQGRRAAPTSGPGQSADTRDLRPYEL